jgi:hypothetical protein
MTLAARSLCLVVLCITLAASAAPDPTYAAFRGARPEGRSITLDNFVYERDVVLLTLNGKLHLLPAIDGETPGAVFIGQGSYELKPATPAELRSLVLNTGDEKLTTLTDSFDSAVFLGTALPAAAEKASAAVDGPADAAAAKRWTDHLEQQRKKFTTNFHLRVLQEIVNKESDRFLYAWFDGKKFPPAVLQIDPRDTEQTTLMVLDDRKGGVWYSSRYREEIEKGQAVVKRPLIDPEHYLVETTIRGAQIDAKTTMTFVANSDLRVLPINLFQRLRIAEAMFAPAGEATWTPVAVIQEPEKDDGAAGVVFPTAISKGQKYQLKFGYAGKDVLEDAGDGNYYIGARTSWYPNVGILNDLAMYELRFRHPQKMNVVAVGTEVENRVEGEDRVSVWKSDAPLRVAGFNYGKFKKMAHADSDSGMTIEVYTNPGTPDIIREINMLLANQQTEDAFGDGVITGPTHVKIDTASLAQSALADGINTARTANAFFGALPQKKVSITQQSQWSFGQSWPSLIYLPYLAFINGTVRNTLGLNDAKDFVDTVGPHEFAHQWWGHQVGSNTYRDVWLEEGFSEFTAAVVSQQMAGWPRYNAFWEKARRSILEKPRGALITNDAAGPISQGYRLNTWQNPGAYGPIVYSKGGYVLHMLRMAMWDARNQDAAFMAMMKDFATTYAGKNPSTLDFKRMAEKHATPSLRLTEDGKLDWFFEQWVFGTDIPKIESKLEFKDAGGGKYKVSGTITQSRVPDSFATVVPMYVHLDKSSVIKFGSMVIVGSSSKPIEFEIALPRKPLKFSVNANHDVLTR